MMATFSVQAQRKTDKLNRGLVAVVPNGGNGVFLSWRIQANEYYGVKYNIYRDGSKLNEKPLDVSNYYDSNGSTTHSYTVKAVVDGVEENVGEVAKVFDSGHSGNAPSYLEFALEDVYDRGGHLVYCSCGNHQPNPTYAQNYSINEASVADLDGDGEVELMVKRINVSDANTDDTYSFNNELYSATNDRAYSLIEIYKLNGERLWWIDCGPNMVSQNCTELNCIGFDWDEDGKAEFLMRGADNMIIHTSDGGKIYVGNPSINTRGDLDSHTDANYAWTRTGNEYLVYLYGSTGKPFRNTTSYGDGSQYTPMTYPLLRLEGDETLAVAWGEGNVKRAYGHRASKYFMGAPYLDGRKPSLFLGRGIYTRIKMCAMTLENHEWKSKWEWSNNVKGSPWYAQGYHNFVIADVDKDGRDEIVYGSMTIDDSGFGLSTTGLGHGDAMHVGDFDPFRKGMEIFSCNEDEPTYGSNFRDATTAEIIYRFQDTRDDGRCMAANVTNNYPGCVFKSSHSGYISSCDATKKHEATGATDEGLFGSYSPSFSQNFRIYWDGDLLDETLDGDDTEGNVKIFKGDVGGIMQTEGCALVNYTKNNPTFQGDILGDWREEIVVRTSDNNKIRIYTTADPTEYRIPSLWYDYQYRNAMVTQTLVYNQPPHVSFFMGEMEGLVKVPVPSTMEGRVEIETDGGVVPSGQVDVFAYNKGNITIPQGTGASPRSLVIDVPSTISGSAVTDAQNAVYDITSLHATSTLTNGSLTGSMNFVKQGDGLLIVSANSTYSYTGNTDVFAGSLLFKGEMKNSPVWMNRHTTLYSNGIFNRAVTMEYGSTLYIGESSENDGSSPSAECSTVVIDTLNLHEGSRVVFDIDKASKLSDVLNMKSLSLRKRDWKYGPKYLAPVFEFKSTNVLEKGNYKLGKLDSANGLMDAIIEGNFAADTKQSLAMVSGNLYLKVYDEEDDDAPILPEASVKMTHVNYNDADKSYGEQTQTLSGYNKISNGEVAFANSGWNVNYITYLKVDLSDYKKHDVESVTLSFSGSGSYDGSRTTTWGIGYNDSEWLPAMTYNSADKSITTIGSSQSGTFRGSSYFDNYSWDISDVYSADEDGILTILIYETEPGGGYVKNPEVNVVYTYIEEEKEPTNEMTTTDILFQYDFEDATKIDEYWSASSSDRYFSSQKVRDEGEHYGIYNGGTTNGATFTFSGLSSLGSDYTSLDSYQLDFDFAIIPVSGASSSSAQTPKFTLYDSGNKELCHWEVTTPAKTAASETQGDFYLGATKVDNFLSRLSPNFYHVTIIGNADGTKMEVTSYAGGKTEYVLSDGLIYIGKFTYYTAKQYGGLCLDDIILTHTNTSFLVLKSDVNDEYETGIYENVMVDRVLRAGYSTLCVPFNATVSEFTNGDLEAYVAYLSGAEKDVDGSYTLEFTNTDKIEANKPYIIYLSEVLNTPIVKNKPVYSESPKTITVGDWSMTGNYSIMSMEGLYGVANNSKIMKGSSTSTLKGLSAFLTGPSGATVKTRIVGEDVNQIECVGNEAQVVGIYNTSGVRITVPQRGINILRMSNGETRKVQVR